MMWLAFLALCILAILVIDQWRQALRAIREVEAIEAQINTLDEAWMRSRLAHPSNQAADDA